MPRSFEVSVESPATVEQVHAAFSDEDYWRARFAALGITCTLDSLIVDADGTATVSTSQDLRHDGLPRLLAGVYPGNLTLLSIEIWQRIDDLRVRGQVNMHVVGAPGSGAGAATLERAAPGSRLSFTGQVAFKVPLVGGRIESYLAGVLSDQIGEIQRFTTEWIAGRA